MVPEVRRCPSPSTASTPCCSVSSSLSSCAQRLTRLLPARLAAVLLVLFMLNAIREIVANI